jgi:hypothetical protein
MMTKTLDMENIGRLRDVAVLLVEEYDHVAGGGSHHGRS